MLYSSKNRKIITYIVDVKNKIKYVSVYLGVSVSERTLRQLNTVCIHYSTRTNRYKMHDSFARWKTVRISRDVHSPDTVIFVVNI
jgi:hypothetical protein